MVFLVMWFVPLLIVSFSLMSTVYPVVLPFVSLFSIFITVPSYHAFHCVQFTFELHVTTSRYTHLLLFLLQPRSRLVCSPLVSSTPASFTACQCAMPPPRLCAPLSFTVITLHLCTRRRILSHVHIVFTMYPPLTLPVVLHPII